MDKSVRDCQSQSVLRDGERLPHALMRFLKTQERSF